MNPFIKTLSKKEIVTNIQSSIESMNERKKNIGKYDPLLKCVYTEKMYMDNIQMWTKNLNTHCEYYSK
jgi:hypothetical protein